MICKKYKKEKENDHLLTFHSFEKQGNVNNQTNLDALYRIICYDIILNDGTTKGAYLGRFFINNGSAPKYSF